MFEEKKIVYLNHFIRSILANKFYAQNVHGLNHSEILTLQMYLLDVVDIKLFTGLIKRNAIIKFSEILALLGFIEQVIYIEVVSTFLQVPTAEKSSSLERPTRHQAASIYHRVKCLFTASSIYSLFIKTPDWGIKKLN